MRSTIIKIFCLFLTLAVFVFLQNAPTKASELSWTSGDAPIVTDRYTIKSEFDELHNCNPTRVSVVGTLQPVDGCVTQGTSMRLSWLHSLVSFGADRSMYSVENLKGDTYLPGSNAFISVNGELTIDNDVMQSFQRSTNPANVWTTYAYTPSPDFTIGRPWSVGNIYGYSDSGEWVVVNIQGIGLVRVNTRTHEAKRFSMVGSGLGEYKFKLPQSNVKISNDGRFVAMGDGNLPFSVVEITDSCGENFDKNKDDYVWLTNACPVRSLDDFPHIRSRPGKFRFSSDDRKLDYLYSIDFATHEEEWVTLRLPGQENKLAYLALGDSYSSGEGDTDKNPVTNQKYYLPFTDINGDNDTPREKCHLSSRSYPFLIKRNEGMGDDVMKSIACSGAQTRDVDLRVAESDYEGQLTDRGSPRLQGFPNVPSLKADALESFIPGRIQQIKFVEKYKPKAITLTMGGNDVGFGDKIKECVTSVYTCRYAATVMGRSELGHEIKNQYNNLRELYQELKNASPSTKIYVLGYPQFISNSFLCPAPNVPLDNDERSMVRQGVIYMNQVIKAAADFMGVKYIDIESAFQGHELCDTSSVFVTGAAFYRKSELQESFHPNHMGHEAIFRDISKALDGEELGTYSNCVGLEVSCPNTNTSEPRPTPYFSDAMEATQENSEMTEITSKNEFIKGEQATVSLPNLFLLPFSRATIYLHSQPAYLGSFIASETGSLNARITIPSSVVAGYHTIQVRGKTFSGEDIVYNQTVQVGGSSEDTDGDTIPDRMDKCMYVPESKYDMDADGIDDACDPSVSIIDKSDGKQPVAMRGDSSSHVGNSKSYVESESASQKLQKNSMEKDVASREFFGWLGAAVLLAVIATVFYRKSKVH